MISQQPEEALIPHEVVELAISKELSPLAAWRKHLKLSQTDMADRLNTSQPNIKNMETLGSKPQQKTLERWGQRTRNQYKAAGFLNLVIHHTAATQKQNKTLKQGATNNDRPHH